MGPIVGAIVVFGLPDAIQNLPFVSQNGAGGLSASDFSAIVYGVLIIGFLAAEPNGLMGLANRLSARNHRVSAQTADGAYGTPPDEKSPTLTKGEEGQ